MRPFPTLALLLLLAAPLPPVAAVSVGASLLATSAQAASQAEVGELWQALLMPRVLEVMRAEGLAYGAQLDEEMLAGTGGARFAARVAEIYDLAGMETDSRAQLEEELADADLAPSLAFLHSDLGRRTIEAELAAREAMLDPRLEQAAQRQAQVLRRRDPARWRLLEALARAGDLVEANVAGAMNANYAFFAALSAHAGPELATDEATILEQVWAQEPELRRQTESWVMGFAALACQPLDARELHAYVAFTDSEAGRVLNRALFRAFDGMFIDISARLGALVGEGLAGMDL